MTSSVLKLVVGDVRGGEPTATTASAGAAGFGPHPDVVRYRLDVIAVDVADVIASAGGWLYDRVSYGWQVTVAVPGDHDDRPLLILGARTVALDQALVEPPGTDPGSALAVGVDALSADPRVEPRVAATLQSGRGELTVWGRRRPTFVGHRVHTTHYTLTSAARVFKAQSLAAAGLPGAAAGPTETLHTLSSGAD
ncbi:hypothetical protein H7J77_15750 [Mycolicibacillus parakoreensis]|uniref:Uncharacterized protein n=1 Tax=Mycolicibacillus parakoreensis TaxID=1069221 RepID=A0ABY3TYB6_9MYCO|nr:hypothetical protein [Mycolicibacillus parakoreensis]MCV7316991.1 hypothetical protein [Mycolicibacillus parakoreensis]ULN51330.1 hypothetical protein MIU77_10345 [Mycolicibacillus parakoreensis]